MVEFEYRGVTVQIDSVRFSRNSVSGIPWREPALCCKRVAYALGDISTPRIRTSPSSGTILLGVVGAIAAFGVFLAITFHGFGP